MIAKKPFLLLLALLACSACSSKSPDEPTELMDKDEKEQREIALDTPESELLEDGKRYFNSELYTLARQNFQALRTGYPNSASVDFAEIKIADCMFEAGEYIEASKVYEDFVRTRPTHPSSSYMLYRSARSAQLSFTGVGRDPAPLQRALALFNRLLTEYPNSPYDTAGLENKKEVVEKLVASEVRIRHFYEKKSLDEAAKLRQKSIEEKWVPVLSKIPSVAPQKNPDDVPEGIPLSEATDIRARLKKIECRSDTPKKLLLIFDRELPNSVSSALAATISSNGTVVSVYLPDVIFPDQQSDCFASKDLTLFASGRLEITSTKSVTTKLLDRRIEIHLP